MTAGAPPLAVRRETVLAVCSQVLHGRPIRLLHDVLRQGDAVLAHATARLCAVEVLGTLALRQAAEPSVLNLLGASLTVSPRLGAAASGLEEDAEAFASYALARHLGLSPLPIGHPSMVWDAHTPLTLFEDAERSWPLALLRSCRVPAVRRPPSDPLALAQGITAALLSGRWLSAARATWWLAAARPAWCRTFAKEIAARAADLAANRPELAFHAAALARIPRS
jgi:hypothetical protein